MAVELTPLINGRTYGWADINVVICGAPLTGIRGIKYGSSQEKENVYGAGRHPVARGYGRVTYTASITLLAGTVLALQISAPNGELHRIQPFPITVVYQPDAGPLVTHILRNAEFTDTNFEWAEGDMSKEIELNLIISDIQKKV
jgi:hypothetical protein